MTRDLPLALPALEAATAQLRSKNQTIPRIKKRNSIFTHMFRAQEMHFMTSKYSTDEKSKALVIHSTEECTLSLSLSVYCTHLRFAIC
jgi:hypothetical protein